MEQPVGLCAPRRIRSAANPRGTAVLPRTGARPQQCLPVGRDPQQPASQTSTTTKIKGRIQKCQKSFRVLENDPVRIEVAPIAAWLSKQPCSPNGKLRSSPCSSPDGSVGTFTFGTGSPSRRSWHRCNPPSRPFRGRCPRTPGGTTGCSCRRTGPSPPGEEWMLRVRGTGQTHGAHELLFNSVYPHRAQHAGSQTTAARLP